jgi:hypothetical protein
MRDPLHERDVHAGVNEEASLLRAASLSEADPETIAEERAL